MIGVTLFPFRVYEVHSQNAKPTLIIILRLAFFLVCLTTAECNVTASNQWIQSRQLLFTVYLPCFHCIITGRNHIICFPKPRRIIKILPLASLWSVLERVSPGETIGPFLGITCQRVVPVQRMSSVQGALRIVGFQALVLVHFRNSRRKSQGISVAKIKA